MIIQEEKGNNIFHIQRYENNQIWINGQSYENSLILGPDFLIENWSPRSYTELTLAVFEPFFIKKPQVVLIGTGSQWHLPDLPIIQCFKKQGIGIEYMDNKSACHTFTALVGENRKVILGIILEPPQN